ncbi:MAG: deoxynucleoside kinase [Deltaproteobacteria bacterium]|nr:MAG: deoxynucleoside kinase [Deltaproteobacteria bacterium]UCH07434.1 MAG: deoxynucleoside kinase [Deltaproteobacteria bacterium]
MVRKNYIAVEGPLGVGKTSLAILLAERIHGRTILEDAEDNPFLASFYQDPRRFAFQTQLFFILRRFQRQEEINQIDLFKRVVVSDFLFDKDRIFARLNLDDREFGLYQQVFNLLKVKSAKPDLVIFLQARTDVLKERIKKRNRDYEKPVALSYLDQINQAFNEFFFHYNETPLLVINASEIDFVNVPSDLDNLILEIEKMEKGTKYYVPLGTRP